MKILFDINHTEVCIIETQYWRRSVSVLVTREKTAGIIVRYGESLFAVTFETINTRKNVRQGKTSHS